MAIIAKDTQREFTPAPEGLHQGVCVDVVDLGMQESPWGAKHSVELRWQLDQVNAETGKRHLVVKRYGLSLHEKAKLRQDLECWRGRKFSGEELKGFDLEKLLSVNAQVQVVHDLTSQGRVFAKVQALVPMGKGMVKLRGEDYTRAKDRTPATATDAHPNGTTATADDDAVPF